MRFRLYESPWAMARHLMGLENLFFWRRRPPKYFESLRRLNFAVRSGERIGIVGRNGAGKSTLLRLIAGSLVPSQGTIAVRGSVRSLMDTGLGFHPEFTGIDNIKSSLIYNNIPPAEMDAVIQDIIDFAELGDFLYRPIRTYSLGMATRLGFATATAVKPEILLVDEVLSAGDGYFSAKSAERMKRLTHGGCTLLLVSHSSAQVLQFCERCVWLEQGQVVMDGRAIDVVKAYESFVRKLDDERLRQKNAAAVRGSEVASAFRLKVAMETAESQAPSGEDQGSLKVSRWSGNGEIQLQRVTLTDENGLERSSVETGEGVSFHLRFRLERTGTFRCRYTVCIFTLSGTNVALHLSEEDCFEGQVGEVHEVSLVYSRLLLGPGDYVVSAALYKDIDMLRPNEAERYDLLDRSFGFRVFSSFKADEALIRHPAHWQVSPPTQRRLVDFSEADDHPGLFSPALAPAKPPTTVKDMST
jgi:lipopolysaccharide transport system ATP-binding protein